MRDLLSAFIVIGCLTGCELMTIPMDYDSGKAVAADSSDELATITDFERGRVYVSVLPLLRIGNTSAVRAESLGRMPANVSADQVLREPARYPHIGEVLPAGTRLQLVNVIRTTTGGVAVNMSMDRPSPLGVTTIDIADVCRYDGAKLVMRDDRVIRAAP